MAERILCILNYCNDDLGRLDILIKYFMEEAAQLCRSYNTVTLSDESNQKTNATVNLTWITAWLFPLDLI